MHYFGTLGAVIFGIGGLSIFTFLVQKIQGADIWGKPMFYLGILLLLGGIQLITTGIVLELLMRTYYESQDKKTYTVRTIHTYSN